jgi:hypothetical protein
MDFAVPDSVKRTLLEFQAREQGFREFDLFQAIADLAKPPVNLSDADTNNSVILSEVIW